MRHKRFPELGYSPLPASLRTVHEPLATFDAKAKAWEDYTATPLGRLRQELNPAPFGAVLGLTPFQS